jgi:hypothetical protein
VEETLLLWKVAVEEMLPLWKGALLDITDELTLASVAEGEKEADSVCESMVTAELGSLDKVDNDSVEV